MTKNFAETLKELRINAGYSQKQVYEMFNIRQSTFSAWETGRAEPSADMLLKLCQLYKVTDVFAAFGYDGYNEDGSIKLNLKEQELIEKYRSLDASGKEHVNTIMQWESDRSAQIAGLESRINSESFELLNAAHEDSTGATPEQKKHADDIMADDSEWE